LGENITLKIDCQIPQQCVKKMIMIAIPKKATTVILLRGKEPMGFEVFLLKRHEKSSFMGGNFVYPGGRVDREDGSLELCSFSKGIALEEAQTILGGTISPEESFAHWIAGVRELYEEAGILFAYDQRGDLFQIKSREEQERFSNYRTQLQKGKISICQLVQEESLLLALDQMHYYAHWITPEARSERFDTRFFLARYPLGQEASHDQKETTAGVWLTPLKALEENLKGEVMLSPPTLKTLEDLSRYKTVDEVFHPLKNKNIQPILPILTKISSGPLIVFPWDPEYQIYQRGEIPVHLDHGQPSQLGDNTTRLLMREGRWLPHCRHQ
jgi:8-oxo-dGTP pyrophosphatase MutT (NUDIX family)